MPAGADAVVPVEDTDVPPGVADAADIGRHPCVDRARSPHPDDRERPPRGLGRARGRCDRHAGGRGGARGDRPCVGHRPPPTAGRDPLHGRRAGAARRGARPGLDPGQQRRLARGPGADLGADVIRLGIARDDLDDIRSRLREGVERADIVIASGGVSVGAHDLVKAALSELGELRLWRVAVQPGKPLAFGRATAPDGRTCLLFGLPGNPVSSFVTFELFVRPAIRTLAGHRDPDGRLRVRAELADAITSPAGRRSFLRVRLESDRRRPRALSCADGRRTGLARPVRARRGGRPRGRPRGGHEPSRRCGGGGHQA